MNNLALAAMTELSTPQAFPIPLTREQLHGHVVTVSVLLVRQIQFVLGRNSSANSAAMAQLLGLPDSMGQYIGDVDLDIEDAQGLGLSYAHVSASSLAQTMEELYDFAYLGAVKGSASELNSEGNASWVSRILVDLAGSHFVAEMDNYAPCLEAVKALVEVCQTAQARATLEGIQEDDTFMDWSLPLQHEGLSFMQMERLSGMPEASLRTQANPKRANALKTHTSGRNTFIAREDAKQWLISKGRYVPLVNIDRTGESVDLYNETFHRCQQLATRLDARLHFLLAGSQAQAVRERLNAIRSGLVGWSEAAQVPYLDLKDSDFADRIFMEQIGDALDLPAALLALKSAALRSRELAAQYERELAQLMQQPQR